MANLKPPRIIVTSPAFDARDRFSRMRLAERVKTELLGLTPTISGPGEHVAPGLNLLEQAQVPYQLDAHPELGFRLRRLPLYKGPPAELEARRAEAVGRLTTQMAALPVAVMVNKLTAHLQLYQIEALAGPAPTAKETVQ